MRSSPKLAERESERGEAGRFMADSENNQDKLAFFHRFRRNPVRIAFFRLIFVPLADALDAPARQCSNKFDIALVYSYLCYPEIGLNKTYFALHIVYFIA